MLDPVQPPLPSVVTVGITHPAPRGGANNRVAQRPLDSLDKNGSAQGEEVSYQLSLGRC